MYVEILFGNVWKTLYFQVVEEDRVAKLPENFEARKERAEYILNEMNQKKAVEDAGSFSYNLFI